MSDKIFKRREGSSWVTYRFQAFELEGHPASYFATATHTHTTSIATDTGTSAITLAYGGKYKLTAGGSTVIFTMPSSDNTNTWRPIKGNGTSIGSNDLNIKPGTNVSVSVSGGDITISSTDTNTWRPLGTGSTDACAGDDSRLSNARTPTSHTHGDINNGGTITSDAITTGLASIVVTNSNNAIKRVTDATTIRTFIGAISSSDLNTAIDNAITTALGADY